jgi:hypothetical protein
MKSREPCAPPKKPTISRTPKRHIRDITDALILISASHAPDSIKSTISLFFACVLKSPSGTTSTSSLVPPIYVFKSCYHQESSPMILISRHSPTTILTYKYHLKKYRVLCSAYGNTVESISNHQLKFVDGIMTIDQSLCNTYTGSGIIWF